MALATELNSRIPAGGEESRAGEGRKRGTNIIPENGNRVQLSQKG